MKLITTSLAVGVLAASPLSQSFGQTTPTPTPIQDAADATTDRAITNQTTDRNNLDRPGTDRATAETVVGDRDKDKTAGNLFQMSDIIGTTIYSADDERIGDLQDVVFDENTGEVAAAVIDVSGWLEFTNRLTPVSPELLTVRESDDDDLTLRATKVEVNAAGHIEGDSFPDDLDQTATDRVTKGLGMDGDKSFGKLVRATKVEGAELFDPQGEEIGNVHQLLINKGEHRVVYAVVSVGDWLDAERGDRLAIPWEMLRQSTKEDTAGFVLNATREQVSEAPAFKDGDQPDFADDSWNREVHTHYGVQWMDHRMTGDRAAAN